VVGLFLLVGGYFALREARGLALSQARAACQIDRAYRLWATGDGNPGAAGSEAMGQAAGSGGPRGGARAGPDTVPSDPIIMNRMGMSLGHRLHATALDPLRPEDAPDDWERQALLALRGGVKEVFGRTSLKGRAVFRYLAPLTMQGECLQCHAGRGARVGEVLGGISLTAPMEPLGTLLTRPHQLAYATACCVLWLLGLGGLLVSARREDAMALAGRTALAALRESEDTFSKAFLQSPTIVAIATQAEGLFLDVSQGFCRTFGWEREEILGRSVPEFGLWTQESQREQVVAEIQAEGRLSQREMAFRSRSGATVTLLWSAGPIQVKGQPCLLVSAVDVSGQRAAQEELARSRELLRQVLDTLPLPVFGKDREGRFFLCNRAFLDFLGRSPEEVLGSTAFAVAPAHLAEIYRQADLELMAAGTTQQYESTVEAASGLRQVLFTQNPMRGPAGEVAGLVGVILDITSRKAEEELLRSSQAKLDLALRSAGMGVWTWDVQDDLRHFDDQVCALLGIDRDRFGGTQAEFLRVVLPEDHEAMRNAWAKTFHGDAPYQLEYHVRRPDGTIHTLNALGRLTRDAEGRPFRITGILWDITERRRAEQVLVDTTQRLRLATASASMGVWDWDIRSGGMAWDDRMLELYGVSRNEFKGTVEDWKAGLHPEDLERAVAECAAALSGAAPFDTEFRLRHRDGTVLWVKANALVLRDEEDRPVRMTGLNRDVTDRRRIEDALRQSQESFASLFENAVLGIYRTTADGQILMANQAMCTIFGYASLDDMERCDFGNNPTYSRTRFREELVKQTRVTGFDSLWTRPDGEVVVVRENARAVHDASGALIYYEGIVEDISERKRAERKLHESEQRFRSLFNNAEVGMFRTRVDGSAVLDCNDKFLHILGRTRAEAIGAPSAFLWADPRRREDMVRQLDAQGRVSDLEVEILDAAGQVRHCLTSLRIYKLEGVVEGSILDITERRQAEEQRRSLEAQLQQAQKMESLGILVAGVAHNLNNVLAIIMGDASLREQAAAGPADREAFQNIGRACRRGREVVQSLIHFAQPTPAAKAPVALHELIQEVRELLGSTAGSRVRIVAALAAEPLWIDGDAGSLNHALVNLCVNALDAMPDGGTLTLRTAVQTGNRVELAVEDDGMGMAPEILAHVLEPFYTTKEVGKGTGLGLSMTYGVVKAHGGTLDLSSLPGRGTTVRLRFPRIPAPETGGGPEPDPVPALGSMCVFLVGDDQDVRFLMARMLRKAGARRVATFANGEEALAALREEGPPDLVILDQNMPGLDGKHTLKLIRELHPELPILISSGQPDIGEWTEFHQPRVSVISKPFTLKEMQSKLGQLPQEPSPT
jgi:PAS domain S-box-containing protein